MVGIRSAMVLFAFPAFLRLACAQAPPTVVPITEIQTSGIVGLAAGQTARLNALNPGAPIPFALAARCQAQLSFLDDQGTVLKTISVTVDPGKSVPFDLNRDKDTSSAAGRIQIRAVVSTTPPNTPEPTTGISLSHFCSLVPTLEIFDNVTGKTSVILTVARFTFTPSPLASGQSGESGPGR